MDLGHESDWLKEQGGFSSATLGLGSNLSPYPPPWASPRLHHHHNLGLVPQLKPKSNDINGQAQRTHYLLDKLGPFIWVQPTKAQINSHLSLGLSSHVLLHLRWRRRRKWRWERHRRGSSKLVQAANPPRRLATASRVRAAPFAVLNVPSRCLHRCESQPTASPTATSLSLISSSARKRHRHLPYLPLYFGVEALPSRGAPRNPVTSSCSVKNRRYFGLVRERGSSWSFSVHGFPAVVVLGSEIYSRRVEWMHSGVWRDFRDLKRGWTAWRIWGMDMGK